MQIQAAAPPRAPIPAATPPAAAPLPEPLPTKLERLHTEALDALRLVMTRALDSITTLPPPAESDADTDEPAQSPADHARTVTQRMRLALTAARDLLRYTSDNNSESPSPSSTGRRCPSPRGRMRVPSDAQQSGAEPEAIQCGAQDRNPISSSPPRDSSLIAHTSTPASTLLAAAGAGVRRFGERIDPPHDSELSTHDSADPADPADSAASPRNSSLIAHTSPPPPTPRPQPKRRERDTRFTWMTGESYQAYRLRRGTPYIPPPPSPTENEAAPDPNKPAPLTEHECYRFRAAYFDSKPISVEVYNRMLQWHRYAQASGTPHPISITLEHLRKVKPPDLPDPGT